MSSAASDNASDADSPLAPAPAHRVLYSLPHKVSSERFLEETTQTERDILRFELNCALQYFLELDRPIFLDGLGIVFPVVQERTRGYAHEKSLVIRKEVTRRTSFEKCDDLVALNPGSYPNMVQARELTQRLYPRLPLAFHLSWSEKGMRGLLRGYFAFVREQLVQRGYSSELSAFGTLYALHNRQGEIPTDRFAGADILLHPRRAQIAKVIESNVYDRPLFQHSFEPLEALYGPPQAVAKVNFQEILQSMGASLSAEGDTPSKFEVGVFLVNAGTHHAHWLMATNGMRGLATGTESRLGTEMMVQLPSENFQRPTQLLHQSSIGLRMMSLGWLLVNSSKTKSLKAGVGLNVEVPLQENSQLHAVLATRGKPFNGRHQTEEGEFSYINLVGISPAEAALVAKNRKMQLLALLKIKQLDQITYPSRGCLLSKTVIE